MTEKRFTFEIKTKGNKAYTQWYDNGKPINSAETIVDLLNELVEEKQQLINDCGILIQSNQDYRKENEQLKSRINDLEWILGVRSDITPVYWGDRNFNCCILDLIGNGRQKSVLNYLYKHYRKNDYEIKDFDNILRKHGVKYGKYGWEKER